VSILDFPFFFLFLPVVGVFLVQPGLFVPGFLKLLPHPLVQGSVRHFATLLLIPVFDRPLSCRALFFQRKFAGAVDENSLGAFFQSFSPPSFCG